jgi:uncharacterized protein involved in type VI secretion and phage assembly
MSGLAAIRGLFDTQLTNGRFFGVVLGIVTNNHDPENLHRVKVRFPWLCDNNESNWARVVSPMAGPDRGIYFLPEVDDEVLVAFEHGRVDHPFVVGCLWNGADASPESNDNGENNHRTIKSRSGHVIRLNDQDDQETIEVIDKTGKNKITIYSSDNKISIEADGDISIVSARGELRMEAQGVHIKSGKGIELQAMQDIEAKTSAQVTVKGTLINLN